VLFAATMNGKQFIYFLSHDVTRTRASGELHVTSSTWWRGGVFLICSQRRRPLSFVCWSLPRTLAPACKTNAHHYS